jgi:hypothetical protein
MTSIKPEDIPIFINSRDRLNCLTQLVTWLEWAGMQRIYIVDNASTYPPLLEYFSRSSHSVLRLDRNYGYLALWESGVHDEFAGQPYIYTDPDVLPTEDCPSDFAVRFLELLHKHPQYGKVGFGLKLDDLPHHYSMRHHVIAHESQFWADPIEPGVYHAVVDTTLALYRPGCMGGWWQPAIRTGVPYLARHLPWYADSAHPTEEDRYYRRHLGEGGTHWSEATPSVGSPSG